MKDFVFNQVYKGAMKGGAKQEIAHQQAVICLDEYKKGKYSKKVSFLIEGHIKKAIERSKKQC